MYEYLVNGRHVKTTVEDAAQEMRLFNLLYEKHEENVARAAKWVKRLRHS
jgi:hypothetical protein